MPSSTAPAGNALDLDALARETCSAVCSDACDALGMRFRTLEPGARHVAGPDCVLIGHARTSISMPADEISERPYGSEIDFVDSLGNDDLVVPDCSRAPAAARGELFSAASAGRGARGALVDGLTRDVAKINALDRFPVFARGARPTDALGRVAMRERDVPPCGAVRLATHLRGCRTASAIGSPRPGHLAGPGPPGKRLDRPLGRVQCRASGPAVTAPREERAMRRAEELRSRNARNRPARSRHPSLHSAPSSRILPPVPKRVATPWTFQVTAN